MKALLLVLLAAAACSKKPDAAAPSSAQGSVPASASTATASAPTEAPKSLPAPVSGVAAAPDSKLGRTYDFVVKTLRAVGAGGDAAAAFSTVVNVDAAMLGDPTAYLNAAFGNAPHSPISFGMYAKPQAVHIRPGPGKGQYTVEQHGDDVNTCLTSTVVKAAP